MGMTHIYDALLGGEVPSCEIIGVTYWPRLTVLLHGKWHHLYPGMAFAEDMMRLVRELGSYEALIGYHVTLREHPRWGPGYHSLTVVRPKKSLALLEDSH